MRLLISLVLCLVATVVIASGTAAVLFVAAETAPRKAPVQQKAATASPRVQAWLDRKAEELAYAEKEKAAALAEKEKAAALAEKERTEALRAEAPAPAEDVAMVRNAEEDQAALPERAKRAKQAAKQEAKRRLRLQQAEAQRAYGYAPERRRSPYPREFFKREMNF